jgi:hypothetical protein
MSDNKGFKKPPNQHLMRPPKKEPSQLIISHGLYVDLQRYKIDGKSALGHAIRKCRNALTDLFPDGKPNAIANALIDTIIYKQLRVQLFESWDIQTAQATPTAIGHYLALTGSLRKDYAALMALVDRVPTPQVPDLSEYLAGLEKVNEED